jgi:hypothetical protein
VKKSTLTPDPWNSTACCSIRNGKGEKSEAVSGTSLELGVSWQGDHKDRPYEQRCCVGANLVFALTSRRSHPSQTANLEPAVIARLA